MEKKKKGSIILIVVLIIFLLGAFGVIYYGYTKYDELNNKYEELNDKYDQVKKDYENEKSKAESVIENTNSSDSTAAEPAQENTQEPVSNFVYDGRIGYGKVRVTGYGDVEEHTIYGQKIELALFHVQSANSDAFMKYLPNASVNFLPDDVLMLGCYENNIIERGNRSDKYGNKEFKILSGMADKILNSSKENPIRLDLTILKDTVSASDGECASPVTYVSLVK